MLGGLSIISGAWFDMDESFGRIRGPSNTQLVSAFSRSIALELFKFGNDQKKGNI